MPKINEAGGFLRRRRKKDAARPMQLEAAPHELHSVREERPKARVSTGMGAQGRGR